MQKRLVALLALLVLSVMSAAVSAEVRYLGCFKDAPDRDLTGPHVATTTAMSIEACLAYCIDQGFAYAGVQFGAHCFCGNSYGRYGPANTCDMACSGERKDVCGGNLANNVYGIEGVSPSSLARPNCARWIGSAIHEKWVSLGAEQGVVGCALTDEADAMPSPSGTTGRWARYDAGEGALIVLHASGPLSGRAFEVHGCSYKLYLDMGGTGSVLGFPVSDEYDAPGGRRSDFEGGYVQWDARTRTCEAHLKDASAAAKLAAAGKNVYRTSPAADPCANPRVLELMDDWLRQANPPENQKPGFALNYESWGRVVGKAASNTIAPKGLPETSMTRCEWLMLNAWKLPSTNLGTMRSYLRANGF